MTRIALVSGGGTGIGRAAALALAHAGHRVVLLGRRARVLEAAAREINQSVRPDAAGWHAADLREPDEVGHAVDTVAAGAGPGETIATVVNNAGGTTRVTGGALGDVAAAWLDEWRRNVLSAVLLTTAALPHLTRSPGARVITVSSVAALRGGGPYGAAKSALHAWTYTLAGELGGRGTANVVAPGYVEGTGFFGDRMTEERRRALVDATLVGRAARPESVASAVRWLASAEAGDVTGQIIQVNGGAVLGRG
ncbi:SDR family NAD(P)-dependent oxidoreductase [Streptomyces naphthomycinicus]|uniref:SDR family NAD(P)-dependent oxidoreductase n=1 Tax=Streptomyces naphthomycinicus TaxID=2872625 RepID=UPI001CED437B|nr:SDR family oxidoreductase [Streptomyces sp. TML10]